MTSTLSSKPERPIMHMVSFSIGGASSDEPCAQTGITTNWVTLQQLECTVYRAALIARFGVPPEGARLAIKSHNHDFGSYAQVEIVIDRDDADGAALLPELRDDGVDERRLARPRRTRETDDESVTEMRLQRPQKRRGRGGQPFEFRDHAGDGPPLALAHAVDRAGHIGVRNARDGHPCFLIRLHHTADKWEAAQVQRLSPGCGLMRGI